MLEIKCLKIGVKRKKCFLQKNDLLNWYVSYFFAGSGEDEDILVDVVDYDGDNINDLIREMEHDSDLENNESGSDLDSTHSSQGIDRWWMKSQKNVFILSCTLFWDIILGRKFVMVVHDSYEWINMLEKCRHLDLIVFHLIWAIGTYGNWKNQNPEGRFGAPVK